VRLPHHLLIHRFFRLKLLRTCADKSELDGTTPARWVNNKVKLFKS
jgi:hypothetical protein